MTERDELIAHLAARAVQFRAHARSSERKASLLKVTTIVASFGTSLASAAEWAPPIAIALLAAIPGAALLTLHTFSFDRKALWHRRRKRVYDAAVFRLKFEGAEADVISRELRAFEEAAGAEIQDLVQKANEPRSGEKA